MDRSPVRPSLLWVSLALAALCLGGCASLSSSPEEVVVKRAQARLDSLLSGDLGDAYGYLSPGYRSSVPSAAWQRDWLSRRVVWDAATVTGSVCEEDLCKVSVDLEFTVYDPVPGLDRMQRSQEMKENWARIDGQWYLVP